MLLDSAFARVRSVSQYFEEKQNINKKESYKHIVIFLQKLKSFGLIQFQSYKSFPNNIMTKL